MLNGEEDGVSSANSLIPNAFVITVAKDFYQQYGKEVRVESTSTGSITLVNGTQEYALANDFLAFKGNPYYQDTDGNRTPLKGPVPFGNTFAYNDSDVSTIPVEFYITEAATPKIGFIPVPDGTGTVKYRYYSTFTAPSLISDNFAMPDDFLDSFKFFLLYKASVRQKEFSTATGFRAVFDEAWRKAKVDWRRRIFSTDTNWRQ